MTDHAFALDFNLQKNRVQIAIGRGRNYLQSIARGFAFSPKFITGSAEKCDVADLQRFLPCRAIHKALHQHVAIGGVLHYRRDQPLHFVKINFKHVALPWSSVLSLSGSSCPLVVLVVG